MGAGRTATTREVRAMTTRLARLLAVAAIVGGCATVPTGPTVLTLPGTGKSFDQFRNDENDCRAYAFQSIGGKSATDNANQAGAASAVIGTAIGAVAGAAIGGSQGAAVGAGVGLLGGSAAGAGAADTSYRGTQRQYDHSFLQCMYARGHRVPVSARFATEPPQQTSGVRPPPPPPPGLPPPPPPGVAAPAPR